MFRHLWSYGIPASAFYDAESFVSETLDLNNINFVV